MPDANDLNLPAGSKGRPISIDLPSLMVAGSPSPSPGSQLQNPIHEPGNVTAGYARNSPVSSKPAGSAERGIYAWKTILI